MPTDPLPPPGKKKRGAETPPPPPPHEEKPQNVTIHAAHPGKPKTLYEVTLEYPSGSQKTEKLSIQSLLALNGDFRKQIATYLQQVKATNQPPPPPPTHEQQEVPSGVGIESWPAGSLHQDATGGKWHGAERFKLAMRTVAKEAPASGGLGEHVFPYFFFPLNAEVKEGLCLQATTNRDTGEALNVILLCGSDLSHRFACESFELAEGWLAAQYPHLSNTEALRVLTWRSFPQPTGINLSLDVFLSVMASHAEEGSSLKRKAADELQQLTLKQQRLEQDFSERYDSLLSHHRQLMRTLVQVHAEKQTHRYAEDQLRSVLRGHVDTLSGMQRTFGSVVELLGKAEQDAKKFLSEQNLHTTAVSALEDSKWMVCKQELSSTYHVDLNKHAAFHPPQNDEEDSLFFNGELPLSPMLEEVTTVSRPPLMPF